MSPSKARTIMEANTRLVIGIDCSTTACKAIAWDAMGRAVAEGRATYPLLQPAPGWYEQDAEQWWSGVCAALKELLGRVDVARVDALCITHQRESFVPVDSQGQPVRHAMLWLDERSRAQVAFLEQAIGRCAGWTAHAMEQLADNRLIRPADDYVGPVGLKWTPIDQRP